MFLNKLEKKKNLINQLNITGFKRLSTNQFPKKKNKHSYTTKSNPTFYIKPSDFNCS